MRSGEQLLRIALDALRFDEPCVTILARLNELEWRVLLPITDQARLTLPLGLRCSAALPAWVRERIDRNLAANMERHSRAILAHREIVDELGARGIPFVFLKGLTHFPHFCESLPYRQQYDIDLYSPVESAERIREAAAAIGYETIDRGRASRTDHLPILIRRTGWRWHGDYYDPEMPLHLEIHFRLWDEDTEMFPVAEARDFWNRRTTRDAGGLAIPALGLRDTLRYASWHLVRHLLRGDLCAGHVYELAHFLEATAQDDAFWSGWASAQPMLAETLAARLALDCFGCRVHRTVEALLAALPSRARKWFDLFAHSALMAAARPNKDTLLLHLLVARSGRIRIAARRLFPPLPSRYLRDPHAELPEPEWVDRFAFLARRALYHARTLFPVARSAARWLFSP